MANMCTIQAWPKSEEHKILQWPDHQSKATKAMVITEIGDHLSSMHFVLLLVTTSRYIRQIRQICQICNFGKPQLFSLRTQHEFLLL